MKFEINNREWVIREASQEDLKLEQGDIEGTYFGLTIPSKQKILIWEELDKTQKRQTLMHELMHCYVCNYISFNYNIFLLFFLLHHRNSPFLPL